MAGDSVTIAARALYHNTGANTSVNTAEDMIPSILSTFSGSNIADGIHNSGGTGSPIGTLSPGIYNNLKSNDPLQNLSTKPKAYLNFAAFDDNLNLVNENSGVRQVQGLVDSLYTLQVSKTAIKKTGFIYIYLSNESGQDVFFDNLVVTHQTGPLLEETHYYPYGLTMAGISSHSLKGSLYPEKKKKYNGIEFNDDFDINEYEANYRTLDPQIGRWGQIDPKIDQGMERWSPYASNYDNPVRFTDPAGDRPGDGPGFGAGIKEGFTDVFRGLAHAATHPIETLKSSVKSYLSPQNGREQHEHTMI